MKYFKKYYKYYLCFLIIFFSLLFFGYNNTDNIWNYGMAHAIHMGEIPYLDFNIITTPLYAFYMSFFLLFYDSYLTFLIGQSLLGVLCYYFVDKMIHKKVLFLIPIIGFGLFYLFFPNYNFLVFTFIVMLMYFDKEDSNDYLIGVLLGLLVLTKHTMGAVIVICSFLSTKSFSKIMKRIVGMIGPGIIFLSYLLITRSFSSFWNLSIMGLFDFGGHNNYRSTIFMILSVILLLITIVQMIKNPKDRALYYILGSFFFVFPIVDLFHFQYILFLFVIYYLSKHEIPKVFYSAGIVLTIFFTLFNICYHSKVYMNAEFSSIKHFDGYLVKKDYQKGMKELLDDYRSGDNHYMFSFSNMFFDIASDHEITYFDIPLYGNFGYDGVDTMKEKVDAMHDVYFYVQSHPNIQYCDEVYDYIVESSVFQRKVWNYEVYYKE